MFGDLKVNIERGGKKVKERERERAQTEVATPRIYTQYRCGQSN